MRKREKGKPRIDPKNLFFCKIDFILYSVCCWYPRGYPYTVPQGAPIYGTPGCTHTSYLQLSDMKSKTRSPRRRITITNYIVNGNVRRTLQNISRGAFHAVPASPTSSSSPSFPTFFPFATSLGALITLHIRRIIRQLTQRLQRMFVNDSTL